MFQSIPKSCDKHGGGSIMEWAHCCLLTAWLLTNVKSTKINVLWWKNDPKMNHPSFLWTPEQLTALLSASAPKSHEANRARRKFPYRNEPWEKIGTAWICFAACKILSPLHKHTHGSFTLKCNVYIRYHLPVTATQQEDGQIAALLRWVSMESFYSIVLILQLYNTYNSTGSTVFHVWQRKTTKNC